MPQPNDISLTRTKDTALTIKLSGAWRFQRGLPSIFGVERQLACQPRFQRVIFDARDLTECDGSVVTVLAKVSDLCRRCGIAIDRDGFPEGLCPLLDLAEAVPEIEETRKEVGHFSIVDRIGIQTYGSAHYIVNRHALNLRKKLAAL